MKGFLSGDPEAQARHTREDCPKRSIVSSGDLEREGNERKDRNAASSASKVNVPSARF